jgi:hypothetical protein
MPIDIKAIRSRMEQDRDIAIQRWGKKERIIALREPDMDQLSSSDVHVANRVIRAVDGMRMAEEGDLSHVFLGWQAAYAESLASGNQVRIPYSTAFVSNEPIDMFEEARIRELARTHEWQI